MNKLIILYISLAVLISAGTVQAGLSLYADVGVDSAPNVYGSPLWAAWWDQAKADVVAGSFDNMRSGIWGKPGTLRADPYDEIVYSTGDLGQRLHWIYWVPGQTVADLEGNFEVKWVIDWEGTDWTYEGGAWAVDAPDVGWSQPTNWEDYDYDGDSFTDGVIGSLGFAWWATDDDAKPYDTGGSPYDETDQADIDALRYLVLNNQTYAKGMVRLWDDSIGDWVEQSLTVDIVAIPAPGAILLCGIGTGLVGLLRNRKTL